MTEAATTNTPEVDHSSRPHAEFGPSGLKYVAICPGFRQPSGTNDAAEKGTRIHEAVEVNDPSALHNEEEVEMFELIKKAETNFLSRFPLPDDLRIDHSEIRFTIELNDGESTFGTCDRFTYWEGHTHAVMIDYKTGIMKIDPAEENWQAKAYVIGAFQKFPQIKTITFAFVVPHRDKDDVSDTMEHTFNRDDLPFMVAEITNVIKQAKAVRALWSIGPNGEIISQPALAEVNPSSNCRFCQYEDVCPAMGALVCDVAKVANPAAAKWVFDPASKAPEEVEKRYLIAKIVEAWADREKRAAVELVRAGMTLPHLKLASMGAPLAVCDAAGFYQLGLAFGLTHDQLMGLASFPVTKTAELLPKEQREDFKESAAAGDLVVRQAERFTLKEAR